MELLKQLYSIHSPSGSEKKMKKFIKAYINEHVPGALVSYDNAGNMYVVKGNSDTYPCIAAHLDQVQKTHSKDFTVVKIDDVIFGYSPSRRATEGLGADDKNGIWIALKCLEEFDVLKLAFFVKEEVGCQGSSRADMSFFKDCRFVVEPDRKGGSDFIKSMSWTKVCSEEFAASTRFEDYGYSVAEGLLTDVLTLVEDGIGISCCNVSCGYYHPHTDEESTSWSELNNCLDLVRHIVANCLKVYPHTYESFDWKGYGGFEWKDKWDWGEKKKDVYPGWKYYNGKWHETYNSKDDDLRWNDADEDEDCDFTEPDGRHVHILKLNDFPNEWEWIDRMVYENYDFDPIELWPYMQADLTSAGWTEDDFIEYVADSY